MVSQQILVISECLVVNDLSKEMMKIWVVLSLGVIKGIFLGYSTHSKAYKCFNKRLKRVVESVNVKIDERLQPCEQQIEDNEEEDHASKEEVEVQVEEGTPKKSMESIAKTPSKTLQRDHPHELIIGDKNTGVQTRRKLANTSDQVHVCLILEIEPKTYIGQQR